MLVAVSIPVFNSQLEKSREATDVANMRAAKAAAVTAYLSADKTDTNIDVTWNADDYGFNAYYDATNGKLAKTAPAGYGKGTAVDGGNTELGYVGTVDHTAAAADVIKVTVAANGDVTLAWE